ncbi:MAG: SDR family oxidoreductase [Pyrinomonadaceae bacterium]
MSNTILVTGATGNVGSQLVKQLGETGVGFRVGARAADDARAAGGTKAEVIEFDFNNRDTISAALKGVEKMFLLTPLVPNMVELTSNAAREAKQAGVQQIVKLSGMGAGAEPGITLGRLHREAEKIIEDSGIAFTHLRPSSFFQNYLGLPTIKTQGTFYLPLGEAKVSLVDTRDIAAVAVQALTKSGHERKAYNITGAEVFSSEQVAEILSDAAGRTISYVSVSAEDARQGMRGAGMSEWLANLLVELYDFQRAGHMAEVSPVVEQVTGRKPFSFAQFAKDYAAAFKADSSAASSKSGKP